MQTTEKQYKNSYRHYNLPVNFPCVALLGDEWTLHTAPMTYTHFHNCIELGICMSGSGIVVIEGELHPFTAGDCSFIFENTNHISYTTDGSTSQWEYVYFDPYIMFNDALPEEFFKETLFKKHNPSCVIKKEDAPFAHYITNIIFEEIHKKNLHYKDSLKGHFLSLLILMTRNYVEDTTNFNSGSPIFTAIRYIHTNFTKKISIANIASECCNLSEVHFRRLFNELMHIGPLDYINHLRIQKACQLIYQDNLPMKELASLSGFTTLSSFNRTFHSLMGCSPSEWKKQMYHNMDIPEFTSLSAIMESPVLKLQ